MTGQIFPCPIPSAASSTTSTDDSYATLNVNGITVSSGIPEPITVNADMPTVNNTLVN